MSDFLTYELSIEPDAELEAAQTPPADVSKMRDCVISTTFINARRGRFDGKPAFFIVFESRFIPSHDIRFKYAEIIAEIAKPRGKRVPEDSLPSIIAYQPQSWTGKEALAKSRSATTVSGQTGISVPGNSILSGTTGFSRTKEVEREESKHAWVESIYKSKAVEWRLSENDGTRAGIPTPFRGAFIIDMKSNDEFFLRMSFRKLKLSKSMNPLTWWQGYTRTARPITFNGQSTIGEDVQGVDEMERDGFKLDSFVIKNWSL
jgi:hypothetical protein